MQKTCVIVPCYNEAARLDIDAFGRSLAGDPDLGFLFVDDGSTDETPATLRRFSERHPDRVHCTALPVNSGKSEAVRRGILESVESGRYDLVGYFDAIFRLRCLRSSVSRRCSGQKNGARSCSGPVSVTWV